MKLHILTNSDVIQKPDGANATLKNNALVVLKVTALDAEERKDKKRPLWTQNNEKPLPVFHLLLPV